MGIALTKKRLTLSGIQKVSLSSNIVTEINLSTKLIPSLSILSRVSLNALNIFYAISYAL